MKIELFSTLYPRLYHMAETGTWESIRRHGLRSTAALLDLFEVNGEQRVGILSRHRPRSVEITHRSHGRVVIRDQKPMSETALLKCLESGTTPQIWFETLNQKVFFWLSEKRLTRLLKARAYRDRQHCVLTIDTAALLRTHAGRAALSPINSGSTIYTPQPRGPRTFLPIAEYPFDRWKEKRGRENAVVELVIDYAVPDIVNTVVAVDERKGDAIIERVV